MINVLWFYGRCKPDRRHGIAVVHANVLFRTSAEEKATGDGREEAETLTRGLGISSVRQPTLV